MAELDLTVTNTWMDASSEQELYTRSSWTEPGDAQAQMDFIMVSRNWKQVKCKDHRAVLAVLSMRSRVRHSAKPGKNLKGWKPNEAWHKSASETLTDWKNWDALGDSKGAQNGRDQGDDCDRTAGSKLFCAELNRFCCAIWRKRADDVVLVVASVAAAEVMVAEVIAKLKEVCLTVGAEKTHWTSHPKMMDTSVGVDGLAVVWEEVLEFVGSKVCADGNARYAIAHRSAQPNKCLAKWRPVLRSSWLPRTEHCKIYNVAGFFCGARAFGRR